MSTLEPVIVSTEVFPERLCEIVEDEIGAAIAARGECCVALPGGSVAASLFPLLRHRKLDWSRVKFFWSDERAVPSNHEDSNFRVAQELFFSHLPILSNRIFPMIADPVFLVQDAKDYEVSIRENLGDAGIFDLILTGVGADGHVCSLFPEHRLLLESEAWVSAVSNSPKPPPHRLTLTLPVLLRARRLLVGASGASKAQAVADASQPGCSSPLARLMQGMGNLTLVLDTSAASKYANFSA